MLARSDRGRVLRRRHARASAAGAARATRARTSSRTPAPARCSPSSNAARAPADRVDHEADDGAAHARAPQAHRRRHCRSARGGRRRVDDRPPRRRAAHRRTTCSKAALIQSANDAADALAFSVAPDYRRVRGADEREGGGARPARHALRPAGRARRAGRVLERRRRDEARTRRDAHPRSCATRCREKTATIAGRATFCTRGTTCSACFRARSASRPATPNDAGWCQVAAVRAPRRHDLRDDCSAAPTRSVRNADLESLLAWGIAQFRVVPLVQRDRVVRDRRAARTARRRSRSSRPSRSTPLRGSAGPLTERVVAAQAVSLPVRAGQVLGRVEIWSGSRLVGQQRPRRVSHD